MKHAACSTDLPDRNAIVAELNRVLDSPGFSSARRSRRLLRYLVEQSLADPGVQVKEYSIALDVFERDASYDPSVDATVRVEAGRLRSRLRDYYAEEGRADSVVIEVPKGGYRTFIHPRQPPADRTVEPARPADRRTSTAESHPVLRLRWVVLLAFLLGMLLGYAVAR